jgi:hypothetical protein
MHTIDWTGTADIGSQRNPTTVSFSMHFNGDHSGDIVVDLPKALVELEPLGHREYGYYEVRIPFEAMKMLVANYVRGRNIDALEQASDDEILFMEWAVTE